ncbi:hypothetical protein B0H12DRAFT_1243316 [Mycena haematopus]|nr:hypothetical protein B0H12DRAFT_1243316 [Mycena haematopus]
MSEPSQISQSTDLDVEEDGTPEVIGDENAGGGHSDDNGWLQLHHTTTTPKLLPLNLDLHSPSFTDAVLSSPVLHLRLREVDDLTPAPSVSVSVLASRHRGNPRNDRANSEGEGQSTHPQRLRTRRVGGTDAKAPGDKLKARCTRLEKELRIAQTKASKLASLERWESETRLLPKLYSWGFLGGFCPISRMSSRRLSQHPVDDPAPVSLTHNVCSHYSEAHGLQQASNDKTAK